MMLIPNENARTNTTQLPLDFIRRQTRVNWHKHPAKPRKGVNEHHVRVAVFHQNRHSRLLTNSTCIELSGHCTNARVEFTPRPNAALKDKRDASRRTRRAL